MLAAADAACVERTSLMGGRAGGEAHADGPACGRSAHSTVAFAAVHGLLW
jgi:hypothetical protein